MYETNVLWNGCTSDYFCPKKGRRQGDPISLYLFVLCIDKLSHLISDKMDEERWTPLKVGRRGPVVSHLMFVDDFLLFGKATNSQVDVVMEVLDDFCNSSGLQMWHLISGGILLQDLGFLKLIV